MIGIIDYGLSNIRSVVKAFDYLGAPTTLVSSPDAIRQVDKLLLPGVGAFGAGMAGLRRHDLVDGICAAAADGVPLLGICLGMQLLFDWGDEDGKREGLGILPGRVILFPDNGLPIPHMGWNQLDLMRESRLTAGIANGDYAYFVHSYHCDPFDPDLKIAETDYGLSVSAIVGRGNVYGLQFHPEKSQSVGLRMLKNFAEL